MYEFPLTRPVTVAAKIPSGHLEIIAEQRDNAIVDVQPWDDSPGAREAVAAVRVELTGDRLRVEGQTSGVRWLVGRSSRVRVLIYAPLDSGLDVGVASADVRCTGRFGESTVRSASGDISLQEVAGALTANLSSGDLRADRIAGAVEAHCASGDVAIGAVGGDLTIVTASGDVRVGGCAGSATVRTASGDVALDRVEPGTVQVTTASGDVRVGVPSGTAVWLDVNTVSGTTSTDLDMTGPPESGQAQLNLRLRTVSGDIEVRRAALAPAS
jgi:DUF4097 and DUF4098 domain-containing protein YvlB